MIVVVIGLAVLVGLAGLLCWIGSRKTPEYKPCEPRMREIRTLRKQDANWPLVYGTGFPHRMPINLEAEAEVFKKVFEEPAGLMAVNPDWYEPPKILTSPLYLGDNDPPAAHHYTPPEHHSPVAEFDAGTFAPAYEAPAYEAPGPSSFDSSPSFDSGSSDSGSSSFDSGGGATGSFD